MSTDIEIKAGEKLRFKTTITLTDLSKAMGHFNKLFKIFAKRSATYKEFTDFLTKSKRLLLISG
jgi:hypothetical protein